MFLVLEEFIGRKNLCVGPSPKMVQSGEFSLVHSFCENKREVGNLILITLYQPTRNFLAPKHLGIMKEVSSHKFLRLLFLLSRVLLFLFLVLSDESEGKGHSVFSETPLCLAAGLKSKPARMLISLVNGGAIVDYRTKDGSTSMHKAVLKNNAESIRTLLDLGASPNYKDSKGLTPLYLSVTHATDVILTEMLLHDHSLVGVQDLQGWQEVHQVCRNGLVSHLELLLLYAADINGRNASGNTPLHVCAVNNQESCARTLLFRGADKEALNFAGQTAYQVAVIAGNLELAEVIKQHKREDIGKLNAIEIHNSSLDFIIML